MNLNLSLPAVGITAIATSVLLHAALLAPAARAETPIIRTAGQPLEATVKAKRLHRQHCATPALKPCPAS